jgi:putative redox protein
LTTPTLVWREQKGFVGIDSSRTSIALSDLEDDASRGALPKDVMLLALAACTAVDLLSIMRKKRQPLTALEVEIEGEQDPEPPWAFRRIHLLFRARGPSVRPQDLAKAIDLADRKYCSVAASLRQPVEVATSYVIEAG